MLLLSIWFKKYFRLQYWIQDILKEFWVIVIKLCE